MAFSLWVFCMDVPSTASIKQLERQSYRFRIFPFSFEERNDVRCGGLAKKAPYFIGTLLVLRGIYDISLNVLSPL